MARVPLVNFGQSLAEIITKTPSTRIPFCWKTSMFFSGLAYRPHISGENGRLKRIFSKPLSRVEIFEKAALLHYCQWNENGEVSEKDSVTMLDTMAT